MTKKNNPNVNLAIVFLVSFLVINLFLIFGPRDGEFINVEHLLHDETGVFDVSRIYFKTLFIEKDIYSSVWDESYNNYGINNPKIAKYIIGFFDYLTNSRIIPQQKVMPLRFLLSFLSAGCVLFFYVLALKIYSPKIAYISVFLLLINPIFKSIQYTLNGLIPMFFFSLISLILFYDLYAKFQKKIIPLGKIILSGIFVGLAIGSKLYALSLVLFFIFLLLTLKKISLPVRASIFLFFCIFLFFIFYISNPSLYGSAFKGIKQMTVDQVVTGVDGSRRPIMDFANYLLIYPIQLIRVKPYPILGVEPIYQGNIFLLVINYLIIYSGFRFWWENIKKKNRFLLLFFLSNIIFTSLYLITFSFRNTYYSPMAYVYILLTTSIILFVSPFILDIISRLYDKCKKYKCFPLK